jgi:hypothetical protein
LILFEATSVAYVHHALAFCASQLLSFCMFSLVLQENANQQMNVVQTEIWVQIPSKFNALRLS